MILKEGLGSQEDLKAVLVLEGVLLEYQTNKQKTKVSGRKYLNSKTGYLVSVNFSLEIFLCWEWLRIRSSNRTQWFFLVCSLAYNCCLKLVFRKLFNVKFCLFFPTPLLSQIKIKIKRIKVIFNKLISDDAP